ncbi:MFS transporter [Aliiroseovarius sp. KMU-50]|uniref:MFS transporter n=1 Tax=Aliiroseovarius salicola TaxID=3009082 RepID=A0ABT4W1R0_9RHOB|nr:MFS transporter [Aliiroseovarius sp. KMU-50]MDA5093693.1 MFS transporter [Aliiroseovarius sp. KMU-50]
MTSSIFQPGRVAARRVILWVGLVVTISLLIMMYGTLRAFDDAIQPEMEKRSRLIGETVRGRFERALELGVPLESVAGAGKFFDAMLADFADVQSITLLSKNGDVIISASNTSEPKGTLTARVVQVGKEESPHFSLPILSRNTLVGEIKIAFDPAFVRTRLQDVLLDVFVVALVSILVAFELVIFVMAGALAKPLDRIFSLLRLQSTGVFNHIIRARDAGNLRRVARRISDRAIDLSERTQSAGKLLRMPQAYFVDVRLALFVFSLATEISGAFLPLYARDAGGPEWVSGDFAAIAPLIAYLVAIAAVAPFGGWITRLVSPRSLFLMCIPFTAAAMAAVGLGLSALWIAVWHGAMALAYAAATIACQEYAIRTAPEGEDAQAIGSYLFVIMGGAFCGTSFGGVLADRIGPNGTFFFGAFLVIIAGVLGAVTISGKVATRSEPASDQTRNSRYSGLAILRNVRFVVLLLCVGATMNVGMSVFIWYLTPMILEAGGARIADIGRVIMLFYLAPILFGPLVAKLADGKVGYTPMLLGGVLLSGVALASLAIWSGFWPMVVVVAAFGIGFTMCDATQYAQTIKIAEASQISGARAVSLGALRLGNRLAAIVGLLASAYLVEQFDYLNLAVATGGFMCAGAVVMMVAGTARALLRPGRVGKS